LFLISIKMCTEQITGCKQTTKAPQHRSTAQCGGTLSVLLRWELGKPEMICSNYPDLGVTNERR